MSNFFYSTEEVQELLGYKALTDRKEKANFLKAFAKKYNRNVSNIRNKLFRLKKEGQFTRKAQFKVSPSTSIRDIVGNNANIDTVTITINFK